MLIVIIGMIAVFALLAAVGTAVISLASKMFSVMATTKMSYMLLGSALPLLMLVYALYCAWPWPWYEPTTVSDAIAPTCLLYAVLPSWLFCLVISRSILRPR